MNLVAVFRTRASRHSGWRQSYLVSHAVQVAHRVFADHLVVAVVVKPTVGRAPALEGLLGSHEGGTTFRAVVQAHLRPRQNGENSARCRRTNGERDCWRWVDYFTGCRYFRSVRHGGSFLDNERQRCFNLAPSTNKTTEISLKLPSPSPS